MVVRYIKHLFAGHLLMLTLNSVHQGLCNSVCVKVTCVCIFQVEASDNKDRVIVFFKIRPDVITPDNVLTNIVVSSMLDSPLNTLYHSMQKVSLHLLIYLSYL